ncbi:30S ribosomal protein S8 [candidate division BRC1 bacterium SM23_51]|nr:MAG: 30S ribosomal protein S8 [candidate division BRC1 bacterium SM23_51]
MTMTDPIADMLTRIRNANIARLEMAEVPASRVKIAIAKILKEEGYVKYFKTVRDRKQGMLRVFLRYGPNHERVVTGIERVSTPGLRRYVSKDEIPMVLGGMGIVILSTSKGIMTGRAARRLGVGGELICRVW